MNGSRIKNTSKNIVYSFILQFVRILLLFINRIIFVKYLGAIYLGVNGLFSNILGILSLADLGMSSVLMYSLYQPLASNDVVKIRKYMNYFKKIFNIVALVVTVSGIALLPFLKVLVNLPENVPHLYLYYLLLLLNTVLSYLFVYKTTLVWADQKLFELNKYDTIFQFLLFISQLCVLAFTRSFGLYLLCNVLCTLICNILKVKKTERIYPYLNEKNSDSLSKSDKKIIFSNLKSLLFYKIGSVIQSNTDNILISIFVGTIVVGYYSNYNTIIISVTAFINLIFSSVKASVGNYVSKENVKNQLKLFNILETFNYILISFSSICFFILIPDFINLFFGKEYVLDTWFLLFVVLNFYTSNIRQTIWTYREATGLFNKTKYITLVTSFFNLIFSIILGKLFGLVGILIGSVLARFVYAWWKEPIILFSSYFHSSSKKYFVDYLFRLFIMIILGLIIYTICISLKISNMYVLFIFKVLITVIIQFIFYFIFFRKDEAYSYAKIILKKVVSTK